MERKLCSIQIISNLEEIEGADQIELATVLGWKVVVKKNEFKVGDFVIYAEIDSVFPENENWSFLEKYKWRVRTIRLRGKYSQGLTLPLSLLPEDSYELGQDVTELLGVTKWELPLGISSEQEGSFPSFIPKTDEPRIQSNPHLLDELKGLPYYITVKLDGTSITVYNFEGEFKVCGRNYKLKPGNAYWQAAEKLDFPNRIPDGYAVQGELYGEGIQKNPVGRKDKTIAVFNVFNIKEGRYLDFPEMKLFCETNKIPMVPLEEVGDSFNYTLEELLGKAEGKYALENPLANSAPKDREGIVVRPQQEKVSSDNTRLSFKVLNNKFLLNEE